MRHFKVDIKDICILIFECIEIEESVIGALYKGVKLSNKQWYPGGEHFEKIKKVFDCLESSDCILYDNHCYYYDNHDLWFGIGSSNLKSYFVKKPPKEI